MDTMDIFSLFVLWIHVIAAVVWVGGNLILAMVIVPHFRQNLPPVERIKLLTQIGKRFEPVVWGCIGVLFFTGIVNIFFSIDITSPSPISDAFMRTLLIKIGLFFVLIILTVLHSMIFAPRLAAAIEDLDPTLEELPPEIKPLRSQLSIVSSLMGVVSLLILLAAVALRMGI
ncbi:MAG: CopD family protein [Candidatus Poribacteria bacterium]|nr:CopD family protein [Candidatus Poribacteria bacterium]